MCGMAHIVKRKNRFYVVAYDGVDPITGRERRRWHTVGDDPADADALVARLDRTPRSPAHRHRVETNLGGFLTNVWLQRKRPNLRTTTAYRYRWMIEHYIAPRLGEVSLQRLRDDHLDDLYNHLLACGGHSGGPLAPKTVHEVHLIIRNALDLATTRHLVDTNVARAVHSPRRRGGGPVVARVWNARELAAFLAFARHHRLYPVLHLAAHTGMRRGELAGLQWRDLDTERARASVVRTIQSVAGQPTIFGVKTRSSRRTVDLDSGTLEILAAWRARLEQDGLPCGADDWLFCNPAGRHLNPESVSQLFGRIVRRSALPVIRFHDLPHARVAARGVGRADQGRHRTARPLASRVHHAHRPAPAAGHERASSHRVRRHDRGGGPVDVYRPASSAGDVSPLVSGDDHLGAGTWPVDEPGRCHPGGGGASSA